MANKATLTKEERLRRARIAARIAQMQSESEGGDKKSEEDEKKSETDEKKAATHRRAEKSEDGTVNNPFVEDDDKKSEDTEEKSEKDEKKEAARRLARRRLRRAMHAKRKRAQADDEEDLAKPTGDTGAPKPKEDLVMPDEGKGESSLPPQKQTNEAEGRNGEGEAGKMAEAKVLAAYDLIEAQMTQRVVASTEKRASLASKYASLYSEREMKLMAGQLNSVGKAGKQANTVRVQKRTASLSKTPSIPSLSDECQF